MLVDNSIVVAENIHRLHQARLRRRDACVQGAGEIALAITMATLTTVVVFVPVSLVEGAGPVLPDAAGPPDLGVAARLAAGGPGVCAR